LEVLSYGNKFLDQKATSLGQSLRNGGFVRIQVLSGKGNIYQVKINGQVVSVRSEAKLNPGALLEARVIKHPDRLELSLRHQPSVQERLNLTSRESTAITESVIKGMMAVRAALDPQLIKRILNIPGEDKKLLARLAGLYVKKGVDLTEPGWEPLIEFLAGDESHNGFDSRDGQPRRDQKYPEDDSPEKNSSREEDLDALWEAGEDANFFHLFNHIKAPGELTLILPVRAVKEDVEISGRVIARFDALNKMKDALFVLKNPRGIWQFILERDDRTENSGYNLSCLPPDGVDRESLKGVDVFREKLSNLRVKYDDNEVEEPEEDDIPGGVDWII